jgi:hypothetical protein
VLKHLLFFLGGLILVVLAVLAILKVIWGNNGFSEVCKVFSKCFELKKKG